MKRFYYVITIFLMAYSSMDAQVSRKVIVEHFTNSVCSICASRNPGFYSNLNSQSDVLHIAYHPSAPYSSCILNQHNTPENDGRTNFYGIYGSTPRLVIQGEVVPGSTNYGSSSIFTPHLGQMSPASIDIVQTKFSSDSIRSSVIITTEDNNSLGNLTLYIGLAEDVVNYNAPNGENEHYDVFRKTLTGGNGISITLPANVGSSATYTFSSPVDADWDFSNIYTFAILQEANKDVVQSEAALASDNETPLATTVLPELDVQIFPNPTTDKLFLSVESSLNTTAELYDLTGKLILRSEFIQQEELTLNQLVNGQYILQLKNEEGVRVEKIIKR